MSGEVCIVVGGQYGSEGKGNVSSYLAVEYDVHVRTGGPNAGHSFKVRHDGEFRVFKQQVLPVGWTNPEATLLVGRGALVNMEVLVREVADAMEIDPTVASRLRIDAYAGVLDERFADQEGGTKGELHERIGSTGEGVGAARVARISRDPDRFRQMYDSMEDLRARCEEAGIPDLTNNFVPDSPDLITRWHNQGRDILVEGTQGSGLSLIHGPWPYVTSADTNASGFAAEAGISPLLITQIVMVLRTYPIRVGGNSGPLKREVSWKEMAERTGKDVEEIQERTTVTQKVRRIAEWDEELVRRAVNLNAPTSFALNFVDYVSPEDEGVTAIEGLSRRTLRFIEYLEMTFGIPVALVGTGGESDWRIVDCRDAKRISL